MPEPTMDPKTQHQPLPPEEEVSEEALRSLKAALARLQARVDALEAAAAARAGASPARAPPPVANAPAPAPAQPEEISEEVLLVLAAAAAAFLGKKPHIRQIRILSSASWAHQGRVSIQASHALRSRPGGHS